jgi:putative FmdB family regulatory protein
MPFYEYECSHCRYYSEVLQKITDKPLKKCPSCGKNTFKKLISAPVFRLKGSGWYETDFKTDKDNKRNLAGSDSEGNTEGKSEGKTDSTAAGSEAKGDAKGESKGESKGDSKTDSKTDAKAGESKTDAKGGSKAASAASGSAPKAPPATTRNVAGRHARGKSAASKRPRPAKRKATRRRGGR